MELDITEFFNEARPADYSASAAEIGEHAGQITWNRAAPGLRGHSVGELYPYAVIAIGHGPEQRLTWTAMDTRTGANGREFATYKEAELDAAGLLVRNLINQ